MREGELKAVEDVLDGVTCALAAYLAWRDGLDSDEVFGNVPRERSLCQGSRATQISWNGLHPVRCRHSHQLEHSAERDPGGEDQAEAGS